MQISCEASCYQHVTLVSDYVQANERRRGRMCPRCLHLPLKFSALRLCFIGYMLRILGGGGLTYMAVI